MQFRFPINILYNWLENDAQVRGGGSLQAASGKWQVASLQVWRWAGGQVGKILI